jgi:hypothetical protein
MPAINNLLEQMWLDYIKINPEAARIHDLLKSRGEDVINDHIALRTVNLDSVKVDKLATIFASFGYEEKDQYYFKEKKLFAKHFEAEDETLPKIFISELLIEEFSPNLQNMLKLCIEQIPVDAILRPEFLYSGVHWPISFDRYQTLKEESEYGAWFYAMGYRPNHFTISVNHLNGFENLETFNQFLKEENCALNQSGGEIKGNPSVFLEQSSTLASLYQQTFRDGTYSIPGCYYEFALRYPRADGKLYRGFVADSADKIFESTDKGY